MKTSVEGNMLPYTNTNSDTPLYLQIVNQLRDMILNGELPDGFKCRLSGVWQNFWAYTEIQSKEPTMS